MRKKKTGPYEGVTQKMMSFRLDRDNELWVASQANKGRYINWLIRLDRRNNLFESQGKTILLHKTYDGSEWGFREDDTDEPRNLYFNEP